MLTADAKARGLAGFDESKFGARLAGLVERAIPLSGLRAADLALAWTAGDGDRGAIAQLEALGFAQLENALRRLGDASFQDEVRQLLRLRLFAPEGRSILWDYDGQGDLVSWLRVVAVRIGLDLRRKTWREMPLEPASGVERAAQVAGSDPELQHLRARHGPDFQNAFSHALGALRPEDRNLLRLYYVDRLTIDELGALFGIHRVSAARRVTKVRELVVTATKEHLLQSLHLTPSELESLLAALDVDVSLAGALDSLPP